LIKLDNHKFYMEELRFCWLEDQTDSVKSEAEIEKCRNVECRPARSVDLTSIFLGEVSNTNGSGKILNFTFIFTYVVS